MATGKKIGAGLGLAVGVASFFHNPNIQTPADSVPVGGDEGQSEISVVIDPPFSDLDLNVFAKPFDVDPDFNEFPWQAASAAGWVAMWAIAGAAAGNFVDGQTKD